MEGARIWITGLGVVTALGPDAPSTWSALVAGGRGLGPLTLFDGKGQRSTTVAAVRGDWEGPPPEGVLGRLAPGWSRTTRFAFQAAREALASAGLEDVRERRLGGSRIGLVVGGTTGGMFETELLLADLAVSAGGGAAGGDATMGAQPLSATADRLAAALGPFDRARTICSACSSGANALVIGATWLLAGDLDAVLVGGADGLCRLTLAGFNALSATDPEPCRPFDVRRRGLNLGEGAGFVVLERATSAEARGARPTAELAGWAIGAEAHHITNPEPTGAAAARVIGRCLARAGLSPRDLDYVNAHGTATPLNDAMEAAALRQALGAEVERIPVSSSKGQVGHTLGAAGAIEAIFAALALRDQTLVPTMGLEEPDGACALVHVLGRGRPAELRSVLSSSFGFGGMDTVLALSRPGLGPAQAGRARRAVVTGVSALTARGMDLVATARELAAPIGPDAPPGPLAMDLAGKLDRDRARRLDRPARLGAIAVGGAIDDSGAPVDGATTGVILGTAFGSLDPTAAYLHRLRERGARFASPAEFPNLVPSSPVGHVSIYHGLRGATLATADLGTSGESAVALAVELLLGGDGDAFVAGAVEDASEIVERVLGALYGGQWETTRRSTPRSEGAAALLLEEEAHARARGARMLARVLACAAWGDAPSRSAREAAPALAAPADPGRAVVVHACEDAQAASVVRGTPWEHVRRTAVTATAGQHEGLGAMAAVAAVAMLHRGDVDLALVVGVSPGRSYALAFAAPATDGVHA